MATLGQQFAITGTHVLLDVSMHIIQRQAMKPKLSDFEQTLIVLLASQTTLHQATVGNRLAIITIKQFANDKHQWSQPSAQMECQKVGFVAAESWTTWRLGQAHG